MVKVNVIQWALSPTLSDRHCNGLTSGGKISETQKNKKENKIKYEAVFFLIVLLFNTFTETCMTCQMSLF